MMYDVLDLEISTRHNASDQINVLTICLLYNVTFSAKEIPFSNAITLEQLTFLSECLETSSCSILLFRATNECFQMWLKMFSIVLQFDTDGKNACSSNGVSLIGIYSQDKNPRKL